MVLANDEDDDKTVQDEEDVPNPTPTSRQALTPRDPPIRMNIPLVRPLNSLGALRSRSDK
ncbi:2747_t:CDS:2 [Gigaspora rosea]|nr:2747_t:CDS:2 [Gigaspora rosea]